MIICAEGLVIGTTAAVAGLLADLLASMVIVCYMVIALDPSVLHCSSARGDAGQLECFVMHSASLGAGERPGLTRRRPGDAVGLLERPGQGQTGAPCQKVIGEPPTLAPFSSS